MTNTPDDDDQIYPSKQVAKVLGVSRTSLNYLCGRAQVLPNTAPAKQKNTLCNYYSLLDMAKLKAALSRNRPRKKNTARIKF